MNKPDVKKLILLNLPYVFAFYFADKIAAVFRLAPSCRSVFFALPELLAVFALDVDRQLEQHKEKVKVKTKDRGVEL